MLVPLVDSSRISSPASTSPLSCARVSPRCTVPRTLSASSGWGPSCSTAVVGWGAAPGAAACSRACQRPSVMRHVGRSRASAMDFGSYWPIALVGQALIAIKMKAIAGRFRGCRHGIFSAAAYCVGAVLGRCSTGGLGFGGKFGAQGPDFSRGSSRVVALFPGPSRNEAAGPCGHHFAAPSFAFFGNFRCTASVRWARVMPAPYIRRRSSCRRCRVSSLISGRRAAQRPEAAPSGGGGEAAKRGRFLVAAFVVVELEGQHAPGSHQPK